MLLHWQIQAKPTPKIWVRRIDLSPPTLTLAMISSDPVAETDYVWIETDLGKVAAMATQAKSPVAAFGDVNTTAPNQAESLATKSALPTAANAHIWVVGPNQSAAMATQAALPIAASQYIFVLESQSDAAAVQSALPVAAYGP